MASRLCQILLLAYLTSALADESLPAEAEDESCLSLKQLRARKMEEVSSVETDASEAFNRSADEPTASTDELLDGVFTAAQGDYSDVMDSSGELGSGWHHHHHAGGNIMTLYHQTSPGICSAILRSGFRPGSVGWCGGGIYFAGSPGGTYGKAVGVDSHHGCILQVQVNMGRVKHMGHTCLSSPRCWGRSVGWAIHCIASGQHRVPGYDSIIFNPGDGTEFMIWDPSRVVSVKRYR
mmetsp:Transcript_90006/g.160233  ORF Transcript_90006/g.160233 Transcript_90006/m.160233 type:complete len:236 (-) Transcript_90006:18-725(-)